MQSRCIDRASIDFLLHDPLFALVRTHVFLSNAWLVEQPDPDLLRYRQESNYQYQVVDFGRLGQPDLLKVFFFGEYKHLVHADPRLHADLPDLDVIGSNHDASVARHLDALPRAGAFG